jgi:hypothetical protein
MKIGVAIPAYKGHIDSLFKLLDSIQTQTYIPDKVVVSCSSTKNTDFDLYFEKIKQYTFLLEIVIIEDKKNAAQNRNISASKLTDVDYITFIDADDIMHPQRIEILVNVFKEHDCDIILHNYFLNVNFENNLFKKIECDELILKINSLRQHWSGCIEHIDYFDGSIHHSQVSVKNTVFSIIKFPEETEFNRKEDCIFCHRVFNLPNIKNAYIGNKLSYYSPSNTEF